MGAKDPTYTVIPQRARLAARAAGTASADDAHTERSVTR
jgi:hypothetical protein